MCWADQTWFWFPLFPWPAMRRWSSHLISWTSSFLICEIGMIMYQSCSVVMKIKFMYVEYGWPLNDTGFNRMGPLTHGFFLTVNTTVLHGLQLVDAVDVEPWIWRNHRYRGTGTRDTEGQLYMIFRWAEGGRPQSPSCSGSAVFTWM